MAERARIEQRWRRKASSLTKSDLVNPMGFSLSIRSAFDNSAAPPRRPRRGVDATGRACGGRGQDPQ
jgi:hypothetical protein